MKIDITITNIQTDIGSDMPIYKMKGTIDGIDYTAQGYSLNHCAIQLMEKITGQTFDYRKNTFIK